MTAPPCKHEALDQAGFALVELALAALLAMLLVVWGAQAIVNRLDDAHAQSSAVWMAAVHEAAMAYVERHGPAIQRATAPGALAAQGYADWRKPTMAELAAAGMLSPGMPNATSLAGAAKVEVWQRGPCPGDACMVEALVYGDRPLRRAHGQAPDFAMMAQWLLAAEGKGAAVYPDDPQYIRGAAVRFSNALHDGMVLPAGTVGMAITAEHLAKWSYLRVRDPRDPDFQASLSVLGDIRGARDGRVAGQFVIDTEHVEGTWCDPDRAIAHDVVGGLLVCRYGQWRSGSRGGGGGYGYNASHGCRLRDGTPTLNPVTGDCSCPWYATAVPIFDSGPLPVAEGRQFAYLCVG